jgi:hypothetical protein
MEENLTWTVGETVIIHGSQTLKKIVKIDKITPTGLIKAGGNTYYASGRERTSDVWGSTRMSKETPEAIQEIKDMDFVTRVISKMRNCNSLKIEQAKKIAEIMGYEQ